MNKHYFYAEDWDLMKKLMRKGVRLYCEEQGLSNDKDFRIISLSTKGNWGHILNFSRCCDYPLNQDRKWEPFDAYYGKVYCDEDEIKNIIPKKNDDKLKELLKQIRDSGIDSKTIINALTNKNEAMDLKEAKQILNENGYILEQNGEGKNSWSADSYQPVILRLADKGAEDASAWLDGQDSDTDASALGEHIAEFIMNNKSYIIDEFKNDKAILKEFAKFIVYKILKEWFTGDDEDVQDLVNSVTESILIIGAPNQK
jgi:hypothetical protein